MGLFTKSRSQGLLDDMRSEWRGRLSHELWVQDEQHEAYRDVADDLLVNYATTSLQTKSKQVLPVHLDALILKLLPVFAPDSEAVPTLGDSARTAYLLASAETWTELDGDEVTHLADDGWEKYRIAHPDPRESHERFRSGVMLVGLTGNHPTQPVEKRMHGFQPLSHYVMEQDSYSRLAELGATLCTADIAIFFEMPSEDEERYRWNNVRAWHLGVSTWALDEARLLARR